MFPTRLVERLEGGILNPPHLNKMFEPKFHIKLGKSAFSPENQTSCLGEQLYEILKTIENEIESCFWYGAHIQADNNLIWGRFESFKIKLIGSTNLLEQLSKSTDQFLSGVFIAIKNNELKSSDFLAVELDTEDDDFRSINIKDVILEIRAFDTYYFSVFSEQLPLIKKIAEFFEVNIECRSF